MYAAAVFGVRSFGKQALGFEQIEPLGHVAFAEAQEIAYSQGIVAEGVRAGKIPKRKDVDRLQAFGGACAAELTAEKRREPLQEVEGMIGRHA